MALMKLLAQFALFLTCAQAAVAAGDGGPDPAIWDAIVKKYVNDEARVNYAALKRDGWKDLDAYLEQVAARWPSGMSARARKAALINAYNALTVRWIVTNYPVESIMKTPNPFRERRHTVDGRKMSLDEVEGLLRKEGDPRVHSVLVCAARSCPPLRREAYVPERLDAQLDDNTRAWLANSRLHEFLPDRRVARVSSIFKWYRKDFGTAQDLRSFLARYSPGGAGSFLLHPGARLEFQDYDWGLNDSSSAGSHYSGWKLYRDVALHNTAVQLTLLAAMGTALGAALWWRNRARAARGNGSQA